MRLWPRRDRQLDARLDDARRRDEDAAGEVELSRQRGRDTRETIIKPLRQRADQNQFAELIRESLLAGYGNGAR